MAHQFTRKTDIQDMVKVVAKEQPFEMTHEATFKVTIHNFLMEQTREGYDRDKIITNLANELKTWGVYSRTQAIYHYTNFIKNYNPIDVFDYFDTLVSHLIENLLADRERELAKDTEASGKVLTENNKVLATVLEKLMPKKPAFDPKDLNLPAVKLSFEPKSIGSELSLDEKELKERLEKYMKYANPNYIDYEPVEGENITQE